VAIPSSIDLETALAPMHVAPLTQLIAALTGEPVGSHIIVEPNRISAETDFMTLHNEGRVERRVAFVWHLDENWQAGDGGELGLVCPEEGGEHLIPPVFNTLTLLRLHGPAATSLHAVLPALGPGERERFLVTGWFMLRLD